MVLAMFYHLIITNIAMEKSPFLIGKLSISMGRGLPSGELLVITRLVLIIPEVYQSWVNTS